MLRRTFLKFLGVTPSTPILGKFLPLEPVAKKFRIIKMAKLLDTHSGTWPFESGECREVVDAPEKWKDWKHLIWLKGKDGKLYGISQSLVERFDRQEEIR